MKKVGNLQKALFYIAIQIVTLMILFYQFAKQEGDGGEISVVGTMILLSVLFFYAFKAIKILRILGREEEDKESASTAKPAQ
jgi:hypothetical protein